MSQLSSESDFALASSNGNRSSTSIHAAESAPTNSTLLSMTASVVQNFLLPFLSARDELSLLRALARPDFLLRSSFQLSFPAASSSVQTHPVTNGNADKENFISSLVNSDGIRRRAWTRIHSTLRRAAEGDAQLYQRMSQADAHHFEIAAEESSRAAMQTAVNPLLAWREKSQQTAPLALNYVNLIENHVKYRHYMDLESWTQAQAAPEQIHMFAPGVLSQLQCGGLLMRTNTLLELRKSAETDAASRAAAYGKVFPASATAVQHAPTYLSSATPLDLFHLSLALSRLLPLACALRSRGSVFTLCHDPIEMDAQAAGYQIHPFIIRWPADKEEFIAAVKNEFPQYSSADAVSAFSSASECSSPSFCGGVLNPDADLDDEQLKAATEGTCNEALEYTPMDNNHHQTADHSWVCDVKCPENHMRPCPAVPGAGLDGGELPCMGCGYGACYCTDHMGSVRGSMWPNCARGTHVTTQLLMRMLGVRPLYLTSVESPLYRPGIRRDWSSIFQCSDPPSLSTSPSSLHTLPRKLSDLLGSTLPWSLPVILSGEAICMPSPALVAAPLSRGWVGGFIATTTRQAH